MTLLGTLLKNHRARDIHSAWNFPNLQGPELLIVTSEDFEEGKSIPPEHAGKRIGGKNLSPDLTWSPPPPETTELLLVVEDLDVPTPKPAVHCLVLIDPSRLDSPNHLPVSYTHLDVYKRQKLQWSPLEGTLNASPLRSKPQERTEPTVN